MRTAASKLQQNGAQGLELMKYFTIISKLANTSRIASQIGNAQDGAARRDIMAKALSDMANSLERFVV